MNPSRLLALLLVGCCWLLNSSVLAQAVSPPFQMDKQYSADLMIMMKDGTTIRGKTYIDGDKMRSEMTNNGVDTTTIIRKDLEKIYVLMGAQKTVASMPYDPDNTNGQDMTSFGPDGKFELIGPDKTDGVDCMKYKVTSGKNNKVAFFWLDLANKVPMRMAAEDNAFILKWRNYKAGLQDNALFEIPPNYQVIDLPAVPTAGDVGK